mgnify:CR=1 FL=1
MIHLDTDLLEEDVWVGIDEVRAQGLGKVGVHTLEQELSPVLGNPDDVVEQFVGDMGLGMGFHAT